MDPMIASLLYVVLAGGASGSAPLDPQSLPEVIAEVNGVPIPRADLQLELKGALGQVPSRDQALLSGEQARLTRDLVEELIGKELLAQEAKSRGVEVTDPEVDQVVAKFETTAGSPEALDRLLAQVGYSRTDLRARARRELSIGKLVEEEIASKVNVDEATIERYYKAHREKFQGAEEVHAAEIFLRVKPGVDAAARAEKKKQAQDLVASARAGKDFADLARAHSDDAVGRGKGGDLGSFTRGKRVDIEDTLFAMKPGDVSEVLEAPDGFRVVKLLGKRPGREIPLDEARPQLRDYLAKKETFDRSKDFVKRLREKATVKVFVN